ncbi:hypothetical protein NEAUS04_2629, partial [Nematocida ausubeli]
QRQTGTDKAGERKQEESTHTLIHTHTQRQSGGAQAESEQQGSTQTDRAGVQGNRGISRKKEGVNFFYLYPCAHLEVGREHAEHKDTLAATHPHRHCTPTTHSPHAVQYSLP